MKLSLDYGTSQNVIRAYDQGSITVNEEKISTSVIVTPNQVVKDWSPESVEDLCVEDIVQLMDFQPEIILLGTGSRLIFPKAEHMVQALGKGTGFEIMDTASACRTYNILSSEDRNVVAALMMITE